MLLFQSLGEQTDRKKGKTKKKKKEKVKTRITHFRIPHVKHNKPHVIQRKKVVEVKK